MIRKQCTLDNGEAAIEVMSDDLVHVMYVGTEITKHETKANGTVTDVVLEAQAFKLNKDGSRDSESHTYAALGQTVHGLSPRHLDEDIAHLTRRVVGSFIAMQGY